MNAKKVWTDAWQAVQSDLEDTEVLFDFLLAGDASPEEMQEQY
jgi:peptide chain release factor 2